VFDYCVLCSTTRHISICVCTYTKTISDLYVTHIYLCMAVYCVKLCIVFDYCVLC